MSFDARGAAPRGRGIAAAPVRALSAALGVALTACSGASTAPTSAQPSTPEILVVQPASPDLAALLWTGRVPTTPWAVGPHRPPRAAVPPQVVEPSRDDLPFEPSAQDRPSLGTGFTGHRTVPASTGYVRGVSLGGVDPEGSLGRSGLRDGDVLLAVADIRFAADDADPIGTFRDRFPAECRPDARVPVAYLRGDDATVHTVDVTLGRRPPRFDAFATPADWLASLPLDPQLATWIDSVLALDSAAREDHAAVLADQVESEERCDTFRLRETVQARLHPASHEALATALTDGIAADPLYAAFLAAGFPGEPEADPGGDPPPGADLPALVDAVEAFLVRTARRVDVAFAAWTERERAAFPEMVARLTSRMDEGSYLYDDDDVARERSNRRLVALLGQVDREVLAQAAARTHAALARLVPRIAAAAAADGRPGLLAARDTAVGRIEIWGAGNQRHTKRCAFRFDLGGDDNLLDVGGAADLEHPVSIHVDWDGNDLYGARAPGRQGAALGGIGVLIDRAGDDQYLAQGWSQGAALAGHGLLLDLAGDDVYRARDESQGAGLLGAGVLFDARGDDTYTGDRFCQGVGFAAGVGAVVDLEGRDRYVCTGRYASEYGEPGVFSGWGQGAGFGFRHVTSGGIGIVHDRAGDDVYEAGNFSQGGGYFHAWGILRDDAGDDRYVGSRYAMGFAAHQASGTFLEGGGDDVYQSHSNVANGLSWDETAVFFRDRGGDDVYRTSGFSLGAAAHNGLVIFVDDGGDDTYPTIPGRAHPNTYHGGTSFALFVDAGGGVDDYGPQHGTAANDRVTRKGRHGFVLDLPAVVPPLAELLQAEDGDR